MPVLSLCPNSPLFLRTLLSCHKMGFLLEDETHGREPRCPRQQLQAELMCTLVCTREGVQPRSEPAVPAQIADPQNHE